MQHPSWWQKYILPQLSIFLPAVLIYLFTLSLHGFYGSRVVAFNQDQARDVVLMEMYAQKGQWFVSYGPKASVGNFYLPPLYYQIHLVLSRLTGNAPLTMHWFTIFIESATPVVLFLLLRKVVKPQYAGLAALAYGFSPLVTIFATFAWNPNMVPFFSLLTLYFLFTHLTEKKGWAAVAGVITFTVAVSLHYQAVVLLPFVLLSFLWSIKQSFGNLKYWLLGGGGALLTMSPYFWHEALHGWSNTAVVLKYFVGGQSQIFDRVSHKEFFLTFFPSFVERVLLGKNLPLFWFGRIVFFGSVALGSIVALKNWRQGRWIFLYFFTILVMMRVYKGDKLDYYMSTLFTLPYVSLAMLLQFGKKFTVPVALGVVFFAGIAIGQTEPQNGLLAIRTMWNQFPTVTAKHEGIVLYQTDNLANLYTFGYQHYSNFQVNPQSNTVIEFCGLEQNCGWNQWRACQRNRVYTYAALLKDMRGYQWEKEYQINSSVKAVVGELKPGKLPSSYTPYFNEYGTDLLSTQ